MIGPSLRKRRHQKPPTMASYVEMANRVAELEAELEAFRGKPSGKTYDVPPGFVMMSEVTWQSMKARAEKAEAEVERLKEALLDSKHWPHVVENIYDPMCVRCTVGGRESVREGNAGRDRASPGAAEPDACCDDYPYCGHDMVRQPDGSWKHVLPARKERASSD